MPCLKTGVVTVRDGDLGLGRGTLAPCGGAADGAADGAMAECTRMAASTISPGGKGGGWRRLRGRLCGHGLRGSEAARARSFGPRHPTFAVHVRRDLSVAASWTRQ